MKHIGAAAPAIVRALALVTLAAVPAFASIQLTVGNPGLQHFDSDGGVELDFGLTDQNGQPVGNLRPDNIRILEDGRPAKIIDFRGVGQGRPVDIVFVMDVTESMQPYIDAVKQNIINFVQDLAANNRDYRLGLVTFEDYVVSKYADCNCEYRNRMTSDVHQFISWVSTLHASGGGDIPEDQLDALAYASTFPFRPQAQAILILITDAPCHVAGDGPDRTGDTAYQEHHPDPNADVTDLTGDKLAAMLKKNGLTLYAVAPPPFIAPQYQEMVEATHGRLYNIVSEEGRFPELVREIGHAIATEYSLTYRTPRPVEDGTNREVTLTVSYGGETGTADTSYQVRGLGGAAINVPEEGEAANLSGSSAGLTQMSFAWWNGAVALLAVLGLVALSRLKFGVSAEELRTLVEAQNQASMSGIVSAARQLAARRQPRQASAVATSRQSPAETVHPATVASAFGHPNEARLTTIEPVDPIPAEYALLKDEVLLGRGEDNDVVIPHPSVSRTHARLVRRNGTYELTDLNSTNGSYINNQPVRASAVVSSGSEVRLGDIRFVLRY